MDVEFYKGQYDSEWQRRDQLQSASSLPVAVLTLLGSSAIVMADRFEAVDRFSSALFWIALGVAIVCGISGIYVLAKSYYGYMYRRIPLPSLLQEYERELRKYYSAEASASEAAIQKEVNDHLVNAYVDAGDRNAVNNANRGEYLHNANTVIIVALAFVAVAAVPFAISVKSRPNSPQRILITNAPRAMSDDNTQPPQPLTPPAQTQPAEPAPTKPSFPQNMDIRTGTQEPRKKA